MYNFSICTINSFDIIKIKFHRQVIWQICQYWTSATLFLHYNFWSLVVFDVISLYSSELMVVYYVDKWIFNTMYICIMNTKVNSPYNFINYILILGILDSNKFLPLYRISLFLRLKSSNTNLKCDCAFLLHGFHCSQVLFSVISFHFLMPFWVHISSIFICKCSS